MSVDQIRQCATSVRSALEQLSPGERSIGLQQFPKGACGDASMLLAAALHDKGLGKFCYVCGLTRKDGSGESHAWLSGEGLIIDITADQFNDGMPPVFVEAESDWHGGWEDIVENSADYREWHGQGLYELARVHYLIKSRI
ncbi:hypothetical protein [Mesorhizobium sp. 8]|uniref:hypothetical protein n=1 Tax=Mesorhizobium sp. 8 TaxID=2584466 RepID=UPI00111E08E1|nr:hypothetical protein [Mesorhizobium sp. 8]QDB99781.1 hypothetical protein FGU64_04800 [Mesorhizobium sp. 8]